MEITKIIVPVDFGKNSNKLVEFAIHIANKLSAEVLFCHVVEPLVTGDMMLGSSTFGDFETKRREDAEERMANLITDNQAGCAQCSGKVFFGDIVDEIVACAKDSGAGMVVIGTHGARGLEKILLGSVAERVVKRSHCPCLVMNPYK